MMIPNPYTLPSIEFVGGSTQNLIFRAYYHLNKRPFDLSACTANFSMINYVNKRGSPIVSKSMKVVESVDQDGIQNILSVTLVPEDTVNLVGKYIYQITIKDVDGKSEIPDQGIIHIVNNINKSFVS